MKEIDLKSTLVAGVIGAGVLGILSLLSPTEESPLAIAAAGFTVGALVQIGVRLAGVS